jgi:hypothetical protein
VFSIFCLKIEFCLNSTRLSISVRLNLNIFTGIESKVQTSTTGLGMPEFSREYFLVCSGVPLEIRKYGLIRCLGLNVVCKKTSKFFDSASKF